MAFDDKDRLQGTCLADVHGRRFVEYVESLDARIGAAPDTAALEQRLADVEDDGEARESRLADVEQGLEDLDGVAARQADLATLSNRVQVVEDGKADRSSLDAVIADVATLQQDVTGVLSTAAANQSGVSDNAAAVVAIQTEVDALAAAQDGLGADLTALQTAIQALQGPARALQMAVSVRGLSIGSSYAAAAAIYYPGAAAIGPLVDAVVVARKTGGQSYDVRLRDPSSGTVIAETLALASTSMAAVPLAVVSPGSAAGVWLLEVRHTGTLLGGIDVEALHLSFGAPA